MRYCLDKQHEIDYPGAIEKFFPSKPLQALQLRERVGCSETERKAWSRTGVLAPARPSRGTGLHTEYDDANLIAALVALEMKKLGATASRYVAAFAELHNWLRARSSLEWPQFRVLMTPEHAWLQAARDPIPCGAMGFTIDLEPLCVRLADETCPEGMQGLLKLPLGAVR